MISHFNLGDYDDFVESKWAHDQKFCPTLAYATIKLAGECGEVADKIGKAYRGRDAATEADRVAVAKELGDLLFYLVKIAHVFSFRLSDIAEMNVQKIEGRIARGTLLIGEGDNR